MCSHAVSCRVHRQGVVIDAHDRIDRVNERHRVGTAVFCGFGGRQYVGDIGSQLYNDRYARRGLGPLGCHLDVFRNLADRGAHAAFGHAVRAAEIEFDRVGAGILDHGHVLRPDLRVHRKHHRDHQSAVGPVALDLPDLVEIGLQRPVGDQLDIVEADHAAVVAVYRAVARSAHVDDRRILAKRLPHRAAPARLEGPVDVVGLVRRRCRREPERIRRANTEEFRSQVSHSFAPLIARSGRSQ